MNIELTSEWYCPERKNAFGESVQTLASFPT